jgi:hypothetical protein
MHVSLPWLTSSLVAAHVKRPRSGIAADFGLVLPVPRPPSGLYPRVPAATRARVPTPASAMLVAALLAAAAVYGLMGGRLRSAALSLWRAGSATPH